MQIILLRHGETQWNVEGRKQGHGDSPLTDAGQSGIRRLARQLVQDMSDSDTLDQSADWALWSSPSHRTVATATIIAETLGIAPDAMIQDSRLMEGDHGVWEGMTNKEIDERFPGERKARLRDLWEYRMPGGESYKDLFNRVQGWMTSHSDQARMIVVTHAMTSRCIRGSYLNLSPAECVEAEQHFHGLYFVLSNGEVATHKVANAP